MSDPKNPKLNILIKPQFDATHKATGLHIILTIESLELPGDFTIVSFPSIIKPTIFNIGLKSVMRKESFLPLIQLLTMMLAPVGWLDVRYSEK